MLGIFDRVYSIYRKYTPPKYPFRVNVHMFEMSKKKECWICFVPGNILKERLFRREILPREGKVIVYPFDSLQWIVPNTRQTLSHFEKVYLDAIQRTRSAHKKGYALNTLGVSTGNTLALRIAADIGVPINHIVSLVGGAHLGICAWESILTSSIARKSGYSSKEKYDKKLSHFSPITYVKHIQAKKVTMRLGTSDLLIPYKQGRLLAESFKKNKKTLLDLKIYTGADHCSTLFLYSLERILKSIR